MLSKMAALQAKVIVYRGDKNSDVDKVGVKNKWSWGWCENDKEIALHIRKITQPGKAICITCGDAAKPSPDPRQSSV